MIPTLVVAFNRPHLLERLLPVLARHAVSPLYFAFDGPRSGRSDDRAKVEQGLDLVKNAVTWTQDVRIRASSENLGVRRNVSTAISWALGDADRVVVLEDDCVPGPSFFPFCAEMLDRFHDDPRVGVVSGTTFCPEMLRASGESYYASVFNHCWGWATWRRAWSHYDDDMSAWPRFSESGELARMWPAWSARRYWKRRFDAVKTGRVESWAYRWTLSCWVHQLSTVTPYLNLVDNVGFGDDGSNLRWSNDPLARRAVHELQWPLQHPSSLRARPDVDAWVQAHVFQSPWRVKLLRFVHASRARWAQARP